MRRQEEGETHGGVTLAAGKTIRPCGLIELSGHFANTEDVDDKQRRHRSPKTTPKQASKSWQKSEACRQLESLGARWRRKEQ
jgi:hypothetical protein